MEIRDNIRMELQQVAPAIAELKKANFWTPAAYFEQLPGEIMAKLKADREPVYYFTKQLPFTIPQGYFESLALITLQRIKKLQTNDVHGELEHIAPILNTLSKKPVYTVPEDYFADSSISQPRASSPAKVISLGSRAFKYMTAAVIIGVIAAGTFFATMRETGTQPTLNLTATVTDLSEQEIEGFLKTTSYTEDISSTAIKASVLDTDISESVKEMSDDEIQYFLQENDEI